MFLKVCRNIAFWAVLRGFGAIIAIMLPNYGGVQVGLKPCSSPAVPCTAGCSAGLGQDPGRCTQV